MSITFLLLTDTVQQSVHCTHKCFHSSVLTYALFHKVIFPWENLLLWSSADFSRHLSASRSIVRRRKPLVEPSEKNWIPVRLSYYRNHHFMNNLIVNSPNLSSEQNAQFVLKYFVFINKTWACSLPKRFVWNVFNNNNYVYLLFCCWWAGWLIDWLFWTYFQFLYCFLLVILLIEW